MFCPENVRNSEGTFSVCPKGVSKIGENLPVMNYAQYRRARKLVRACCNYDNGNCIALDDGDECICVQSVSYSLLCRWFHVAVLPLDKGLETALLYRERLKKCAVCGQHFVPASNRAKYCRHCAATVHRRQKAESERKRRLSRGQLEEKKP